MEMRKRWDRLVKVIGNLRGLLRRHRYNPVGVGIKVADELEIQAAWNECHEALECVLGTQDDNSLMLNRLKNARRYFQDGERWPAEWEVTQALRRAKQLQRLYGCE
jgi:hypothetical protein